MFRMINTCATLILALAATVAGAQSPVPVDDPWTTVAEEGWWTLENGLRLDLSSEWKVIRHQETGRERVVPQAFGTASLTIETFPFSAFQMISSSVSWTEDIVTGYGQRMGSGPATCACAPSASYSGAR